VNLTVTCPTCKKQETKPYGAQRAAELADVCYLRLCPSCAGKRGGRTRRPRQELALRCGCGRYMSLVSSEDDRDLYACVPCGLDVEHES
jgi:hypothetical protein